MKRFFMAAAIAACMFSMSAITLGFRGDVDFGVGTIEKYTDETTGAQLDKTVTEKAETITSGTAAIWTDIPVINLGIVSVGLRPECEIALGEGFAVKNENGSVVFNSTSISIPLFVDVCVNISAVRVSAGVGAYVAMPLTFTATEKKIGNQEIQTPKTGWDAKTWGVAGYVQAGLKVGPGYILGDARLSTAIDPQELVTSSADGTSTTTLLKSKTYKIGLGVGYEFKF